MIWKSYWTVLSKTSVIVMAFILLMIAIIDPYDNLPFSPDLKRTAMASNQRFSYPAIARKDRFDSAVFGTSTTRLLNPENLNEYIGGNFANLSMNSATSYEQSRLFDVYIKAHSTPKNIIIGLDITWCNADKAADKYTFRAFPEWMYDDNPWNDISHMLNFKTLETLGKQAGYLIGIKDAKYQPTGYANFLPSIEEYDLGKARMNIYGSKTPKEKNLPSEIARYNADNFSYPSHDYLKSMLDQTPAETKKILMFVPYHSYIQASPGSLSAAQWKECKKRITAISAANKNSFLIDFMIPSIITNKDENYWDPLHYTEELSVDIIKSLASGLENKPAPHNTYQILEPY
ncbi:hypothetical protein [Kiloniella spongiae]|uniref:hypothetical protein n=1 Tax=Kiloniella spongiae TaxID=1489064 RepID=UPI0006995889|nr:hypothetical protein [Kiloniella spongiae]